MGEMAGDRGPRLTATKKTISKHCVPAKQSQPTSSYHPRWLGTSEVAKADDDFYHVTPDLVSIEKTNIPNKYKVTLVRITYCLKHRVKQAIETKRSHYRPLRRALLAQGHILPEVVVIVACARGSIPASTLETLRNDLGLNRAAAETILRKTHLAACEHMRRMIHLRRAVEALTMGPQGIVTKLFQRDKMRRGRPLHGNAPPNTSRPRREETQWLRDFERSFWRFGVLFGVFFLIYYE
jgi:hypothetical protein